MGRADDSLRVVTAAVGCAPPWKVLIADDEPEVHDVTRLVLGGFRFDERPLEFLSAHSAREAQSLLRAHPDIAVLLLDVVMESEQAGLALVRCVRGELANPFVRIVLRTGQAGQAPEHEVIAAYDINDYKEKTELTAARLATTMYAALRAYRDMRTIAAQREGLENVIRASARVFAAPSPRDFAASVLDQLGSLVGPARGFCCTPDAAAPGEFRIIGCSDGAGGIGARAGTRLPPSTMASLQAASRLQEHRIGNDHYVLQFARKGERLFFVGEGCEITPVRRQLLELFGNHAAIAFENLHLNDELVDSQLEMVYLLAGAVETRSQETANHVHRVGLLAEILGRAAGHDAAFCETLRYAAPLHDIGKIGIPDTILNKPGQHDAAETAIMRTHADIGARLLGTSHKPVLRLAATIAGSHHENWDGSGYPLGLAGAAIPVAGRITMVADVFDALGSRRCYKEPWSHERIRALLQEQRGRKFDPALVDCLFACWDEAMALREQLPD
jgi:response regulator RpfG family c-di-GMP phosphodiesterase